MEGTRFRLYPQPRFLDDFEEPETVYVSSPCGSLAPGPSDDRMYTIFPIGKTVTLWDQSRSTAERRRADAALDRRMP